MAWRCSSRCPRGERVILIGLFDSPFVRRVAVSLRVLGMPFAHEAWSVGKDFTRIRVQNPLGRVPALMLENGEVLIESGAILDYLDELAGPERALLPARGSERRRALKLMALATGAADKALQLVIERAFRPEDKRHAPWTDRCREQSLGALAELEQLRRAAPHSWLLGERLLQPDITLGCALTFITEGAGLSLDAYPALQAHRAGCEALPTFAACYLPFYTPKT